MHLSVLRVRMKCLVSSVPACSTRGLQSLFSCFEYADISTDHQSSAVFLHSNTHACIERERERAGATSCTWQHAVFQSVSGKRWSAAFSPLKAAAAEIPAEWLLFTHFSFGQADGSFHSPVYAQWRLNTCKTISSVFRQPIILSFVYFYLTRFGV